MIDFWRVLTSLVLSLPTDDANVGAMLTRLSPSSFSGVKRASFLHKGCPDRWSGHSPPKLKLEKNKDGSNSFKWICTRMLFFMLLLGFYRADGTFTLVLMVYSCLFCDDDCHQGGNQALARGSMPSSLHRLSNHTKQNPLTSAIC